MQFIIPILYALHWVLWELVCCLSETIKDAAFFLRRICIVDREVPTWCILTFIVWYMLFKLWIWFNSSYMTIIQFSICENFPVQKRFVSSCFLVVRKNSIVFLVRYFFLKADVKDIPMDDSLFNSMDKNLWYSNTCFCLICGHLILGYLYLGIKYLWHGRWNFFSSSIMFILSE